MDELGKAGSNFRSLIYDRGFDGTMSQVSVEALIAFLDTTQEFLEHSLRANRRSDALYHSYNLLRLESGRAYVDRLYEMLEGQVSILSSGLLSGEESLSVLESLRRSSLYRADQHTYILYPDRILPSFFEKNSLLPEQLNHLELPFKLVKNKDGKLFTQDIYGMFHFAAAYVIEGCSKSIDCSKGQPEYAALVNKKKMLLKACLKTPSGMLSSLDAPGHSLLMRAWGASIGT